jgi:hypothetical protein
MWQYLNMPETKLYSCRNSEQNKFQTQYWLVQNLFSFQYVKTEHTIWILRTRCWGEYLETGENCMIRVFIICILQAILLQLPHKSWTQLITARCAPRISKTENIKTIWNQVHYIKILAGCQTVLKIHRIGQISENVLWCVVVCISHFTAE